MAGEYTFADFERQRQTTQAIRDRLKKTRQINKMIGIKPKDNAA